MQDFNASGRAELFKARKGSGLIRAILLVVALGVVAALSI